MKLIHLSDLHLGKRVNEFSMLEEQANAISQIIDIVKTEKPDGVIIAGDVYDKSQPPAEAVRLFDMLLFELSRQNTQVFVISGNHDSAERIAFGGRIMNSSGVHLSPVFNGSVEPVTLTDEFGEADIFMLPFVKPSHVRRFFEDEEINSYTDAVRCAIEHMEINPNRRNVLVTHQFVTGAQTCESEEISVGGTDNVDASVFEPFDYVALGHIHGAQSVSRDTIRYSGTPLKYSFSEIKHQKSATIVELGSKGDISIKTAPIIPINDMREVRGEHADLMKNEHCEDYMRVILTDEQDVPEAIGKLRDIYPNIMRLEYDNSRTRAGAVELETTAAETKSPIELFGELFYKQNNKELTEEQTSLLQELIEEIWEGEK